MTATFDPTRDLVIERTVAVAPELVWAAWTQPEHLTKWFTPAPWTTPEAEIDLRPGGIFRAVMRSPEGELTENTGCYLVVEENRRLVWTGALRAGYRPNDVSILGFPFTAEITIEPVAAGTKYAARVMHATPADCTAHADMGFADGWGSALDQLVAHLEECRA